MEYLLEIIISVSILIIGIFMLKSNMLGLGPKRNGGKRRYLK